ncbi:DNA-directed DNA polymerase gamma mip1 [Ceratobasidium sp. 414]|nr:DNA-directed DNA polymerase gamma mip1 [Ceratobasidium sp. 414]
MLIHIRTYSEIPDNDFIEATPVGRETQRTKTPNRATHSPHPRAYPLRITSRLKGSIRVLKNGRSRLYMLYSAGSSRSLIASATKFNNIARPRRWITASACRPRILKPLTEEGVNRAPPPPPIKNPRATNKVASKAPKSSKVPKPVEPPSGPPPDVVMDRSDPANKLINQVGVQLLSPELHSQIFAGVSLPVQPEYTDISRNHLKGHGLDTDLASRLPETSFDLPTLQGKDIDEHFYRIGAHMAEPWLTIAKDFAGWQGKLPAKPEYFDQSPGWTKYNADGSFEHVDDLASESAICFDVETLPAYSPFAIMACAVSPTAWYVWISPWLLNQSTSPEHLIPLGDPPHHRIIVGHNVSYDRARILEEYSLQGTKNRFLDTMALHIAVNGISSGQRPAWASHRKLKRETHDQRREAAQAVQALIQGKDCADLLRYKGEMEESLPELMADESGYSTGEKAAIERWEDITSANSLADIARLYCGIDLDKTTRDDFMTCSQEEILDDITQYLLYCASDVSTTFDVYCKVLHGFLKSCPSPVSAAGVLTMGSSFLTLDQEWDNYIKSAESKYHELEDGVRTRLLALAKETFAMYQNDTEGKKPWEADEWLDQLDWTPKKVGTSRGGSAPAPPKFEIQPKWYADIQKREVLGPTTANHIIPFLLRMTWHDTTGNYYLFYSSKHGWLKGKPVGESQYEPAVTIDDDDELARFRDVLWFVRLAEKPVKTLLSRNRGGKWIEDGTIDCDHDAMALRFCTGTALDNDRKALRAVADEVLARGQPTDYSNIAISQLDWKPIRVGEAIRDTSADVYWPKWYWELTASKPGLEPGTPDLTVRSRVSPLLMRLSWLGHPLFHSRQHGWTYRVPGEKLDTVSATSKALIFHDEGDVKLQEMCKDDRFIFYKLPHKDGEQANVGSPMSKPFLKYSQDGTLTGSGDEVKSALDMNAQCSYWISARDRIRNQVVLWDGRAETSMGMPPLPQSTVNPPPKYGMVLPQVITMGTVTRRAIEKTWLTASNAKTNRIGSELKALVRAPEGYALVGADVDSEELWIASVMGDAQFGIHGATAIGWMTLEGTKAAGTDLHSKTASILGISRNDAKVFNYSRIYGAGTNHAVLLLLQHNASLKQRDAKALAKGLYASTKGKSAPPVNPFGRKFWHGGTESYLFNKLEDIALSNEPRTPALGCGITAALSKKYLPKTLGTGEDYMTSRINWVVQSSGVDYLHMLIVAVDYLVETYNIDARYLISIHDEVRYLAKEQDKYRLALALQIANLWTRCMFAYKLGFDNLPQGVAFFSAVDVDRYLRKEVDMNCVTPSQPIPLPPGESLTIEQILDKTAGGLLGADASTSNSSIRPELRVPKESEEAYVAPNVLAHREKSIEFLRAQMTVNKHEVQVLGLRARANALERVAEMELGLDQPRVPQPKRPSYSYRAEPPA